MAEKDRVPGSSRQPGAGLQPRTLEGMGMTGNMGRALAQRNRKGPAPIPHTPSRSRGEPPQLRPSRPGRLRPAESWEAAALRERRAPPVVCPGLHLQTREAAAGQGLRESCCGLGWGSRRGALLGPGRQPQFDPTHSGAGQSHRVWGTGQPVTEGG